MNFKPFKMAQFSAQWPAGSLLNMHSSNPEPWTWNELEEQVPIDLHSLISNTSFAYEAVQGNGALRELISAQYHVGLSHQDVVLTSGAQEGIFLVLHALLQPENHVITFSPGFEPLAKVALDIGARVDVLPLDEQQGWRINWQQLEATINDDTQLVIINFPHNPTGTHLSADEFNRLIALCERHGSWLFSDEVFRGLEHRAADRLNSAADIYAKAISMGVVSKALALPGIRLGWLVCQNQKLIKQVMTVKSHLSICQSSLDSQVCQALIPYSEHLWQRNLTIINNNKAFLTRALSNHDVLSWHPPTTAATAFIQCKGVSAKKMVSGLANQHQMILMPNEVFMTAQSGFRLTLGLREAEAQYEQIIQFQPPSGPA